LLQSTLIINAKIVNENNVYEADVRIKGQRIEKISPQLLAKPNEQIIDANGAYLLPGMIDDQVHFREPGLTQKGNIASESRAAVAGGITSYMEMPNVSPSTTTIAALEKKYAIAAKNSKANYAFYLGATENNLEQIKQLDPKKHCGVKIFMGASTGDLLVENPVALEAIFRDAPTLIVTHCESGAVIQKNLNKIHRSKLALTIEDHPVIRDTEACYASSSYAVSLAKKYASQLHVLHITTKKELSLFASGPITGKNITAEACVHHLWFTDKDYPRLGNLIKCNPSIKSEQDRDALIQAIHTGQIDIIATDHAPHTLAEKQKNYDQAPAGLPLVQHAMLTLFDHVAHNRMTLSQITEKTAHNPALRYAITERGFIREGYFADLVLVDTHLSTIARHDNNFYKCAWTPFDNHRFNSKVMATWVNGQQVYNGQDVSLSNSAMPLLFDRS
jgi:dihydroorotase